MANRFFGKRRGFTIAEVLIVILIMGTMAAVMTFNPKIASQSAKFEADRVALYIDNLMRKSDKLKMKLCIRVKDNSILAAWNDEKWGSTSKKEEPFNASSACTYPENNFPSVSSYYQLVYDYNNYPHGAKISVIEDKDSYDNSHSGQSYVYIKVTGGDDKSAWVIISAKDTTSD